MGFAMGGPVARDQFFWFLSYDKFHRNFPGLAVDDRNRRDSDGDLFISPNFNLDEFCDAFGEPPDDGPDGIPGTGDDIPGDPGTGNGLGIAGDPDINGDGLPDDPVIGQSRCDGARALLLDELGPFNRKGLNDTALGKLDWNINDKHTLGGQYNYHKWRSPNGIQTQDRTNDTPLANGFDGVRTDTVLIKLNSILTTTTINEFRFQYARDFTTPSSTLMAVECGTSCHASHSRMRIGTSSLTTLAGSGVGTSSRPAWTSTTSANAW
jgi:hypothetical protein